MVEPCRKAYIFVNEFQVLRWVWKVEVPSLRKLFLPPGRKSKGGFCGQPCVSNYNETATRAGYSTSLDLGPKRPAVRKNFCQGLADRTPRVGRQRTRLLSWG